jgi:hypothetical protein
MLAWYVQLPCGKQPPALLEAAGKKRSRYREGMGVFRD